MLANARLNGTLRKTLRFFFLLFLHILFFVFEQHSYGWGIGIVILSAFYAPEKDHQKQYWQWISL